MTVISPSKSLPILSVSIFALAGAVTRFLLRDTETRFQILGFWLAAIVVTLFLPRPSRASNGGWALLLNGAAATVAIMLMKIAIEGPPRALDHVLMGL